MDDIYDDICDDGDDIYDDICDDFDDIYDDICDEVDDIYDEVDVHHHQFPNRMFLGDIYDDLDVHHPQSDKKFGLKTSFWTHLQTDEGAEGDEVVDEDVWHPGLSVDTPSLSSMVKLW